MSFGKRLPVPVAYAVVLAIMTCSSLGCRPKVYEIQRGGDPDETVTMLFLGDGFEQAELPAFHAAASHLTEKLLETWPFCRVKHRLNFYRIDLVDDGELAYQGDCKNNCCLGECPSSILPPGGGVFEELRPAPAISGFYEWIYKDLEVTRCYHGLPSETGPCEILWPSFDGDFEARRLMEYGPNVSVAVIIVNMPLVNGGGLAKISVATKSMAVVGVPVTSSGGPVNVTSEGHRLFSHELAHALGLLDEYVGYAPNPPSLSPNEKKRNVWQPDPGPWATQTVPWADLPQACQPSDMKLCCGIQSGGAVCEPCFTFTATPPQCVHIPAKCQDPMGVCPSGSYALESGLTCTVPQGCDGLLSELCPPDDPCGGTPGAWEGAEYHWEGLYRFRQYCRMGTSTDKPFCEACAAYLWKTHFCIGPACAAPGPILGPCN